MKKILVFSAMLFRMLCLCAVNEVSTDGWEYVTCSKNGFKLFRRRLEQRNLLAFFTPDGGIESLAEFFLIPGMIHIQRPDPLEHYPDDTLGVIRYADLNFRRYRNMVGEYYFPRVTYSIVNDKITGESGWSVSFFGEKVYMFEDGRMVLKKHHGEVVRSDNADRSKTDVEDAFRDTDAFKLNDAKPFAAGDAKTEVVRTGKLLGNVDASKFCGNGVLPTVFSKVQMADPSEMVHSKGRLEHGEPLVAETVKSIESHKRDTVGRCSAQGLENFRAADAYFGKYHGENVRSNDAELAKSSVDSRDAVGLATADGTSKIVSTVETGVEPVRNSSEVFQSEEHLKQDSETVGGDVELRGVCDWSAQDLENFRAADAYFRKYFVKDTRPRKPSGVVDTREAVGSVGRLVLQEDGRWLFTKESVSASDEKTFLSIAKTDPKLYVMNPILKMWCFVTEFGRRGVE